MAEEQSGQKYKFTGMKSGWDQTDRIVLEGSSTNPERFVDLGGEIDLSDEEAERLRKSGVKLKAVSGDVDDSSDDDDETQTKAEQQDAQAATSGAQGPAASREKDKRPGAQSGSK